MIRLASFLPRALHNEDVLAAARAQKVLRKWSEVVGPGLANRSFPDRFDKGTVWVAVQGSAWAQELRMMKEVIVSKLNDLADEPGLFRDVRFGVRPLPTRRVEVLADDQEQETKRHKSIREIAEERLNNWKE